MASRRRAPCPLAAVLSAILAACARGDPTERPIAVGFSQIGAESAWRTAETESIRAEARARGIELRFSDAQQKQENQIRAIRTFLAQKVDAIVLAPIVESGWEPVLREAKSAGVPVVLVDRGVDVADDSLYATLVASDFIEEGRMAARWLAKRLGGKGRVVELRGTPGAVPAIDRKRGFEEALAAYPDLVVVRSQSGEFTRAKGKEAMETFLHAEGNGIDAVYAHNDDMALGAIQAIEEAGRKPGADLVVVSIDGVRAAFDAMAAGKLQCTVECNPLLGPAAFDAIEKILAGESVPKWIRVEDRIFEAPVAPEIVASRKY
jgi:simple sugar transport system substrate-binding protein